MIVETQGFIIRGRSRCRRRIPCLSSVIPLWQKQTIYVFWERYLSAVKRHCNLRLPCCVLVENTPGKYELLHMIACRESE